MSADTLRRAAALMRERAEAATPGPWHVEPRRQYETILGSVNKVVSGRWTGDPNVEHIASWHPDVALAVADLLDWVALNGIPDPHESDEDCFDCEYERQALTVARAYLGESA